MSELDHNGDLSEEEIAEINANLAEKGIPTKAEELIENTAAIVPASKNPGKFVDTINK